MSETIVEILPSDESVAIYAASLLNEWASEDEAPMAVALAGGSTPKRLYQLLAQENELPWERFQWYFGDERSVPADDADSNYRMAREALFDAAGINADSVHRVKTELGDPASVAQDYEKTIKERVPLNDQGVPVFDVIFLGMGTDGHTASLFPHTTALDVRDRAVVENHVTQLDTWRYTLTAPVLLAAKRVVLLVTGASKTQALWEVLEGDENVAEYPTQLLREREGETLWLVDEAAAGNLWEEADDDGDGDA